MKYFRFVVAGALIAFAACQDPVPSTRLAANPKAISSSNKQSEAYHIDTAAVLMNLRLNLLLTQAQKENLITHHSAKALPPVIVAFLERVHQEPIVIADIGAPYEATDVIDGSLPSRQLTYLGIGKSMVLLAYNLGGYGVSERVLLFQLKNGAIVDFWTGYVRGNQRTKEGIIRYLRENKAKKWGVNTNLIYF